MRTLTVFFFALLPSFLFSQSSPAFVDARLYEVYDRSYIESLQKKNPFLLERWAYYLDHAWYITSLAPEKTNDNIPVIVIKDTDHINILLLEKEQKLTRKWDTPSVYKIAGSNKFLVYLPGRSFNEKMKAYFAEKHME